MTVEFVSAVKLQFTLRITKTVIKLRLANEIFIFIIGSTDEIFLKTIFHSEKKY